jgi:uncharacterized protein YjbI with pentapeptide repeats
MNKDNLRIVLDNHALWLVDKANGDRADLSGADLCGVNLRDANLSGVNLSRANLSWANLSRANLRDADLRWADLCGVNLSGADLRDADLRLADLRLADLCDTKDGAICRMDFGGWSICIRSNATSIGCKKRDNEFWLSATDDEISHLDAKALEWWKVYGSAIKESIRVIMELSR